MTPPRTLDQLSPGEEGQIEALLCTGSMRRRLLDIGLTENTRVTCLHRAPGGDPSAYLIRGAVIAIRAIDGKDILLKETRVWD
ncbi:MAG: ferrous iron transport protein A [Clostridia bacterium]|nr:ferrous iron transport protein A [Clostridia bacterium]